jgi:hypothetical protein
MNPTQPVAVAPDRIHPESLPGYVQLKGANLKNQILFYERAIGLQVNWQDDARAGLGVKGEIACFLKMKAARLGFDLSPHDPAAVVAQAYTPSAGKSRWCARKGLPKYTGFSLPGERLRLGPSRTVADPIPGFDTGG